MTRTARRQILVVEDHEDIADSIREILEMEGYEVITADSGEAALDALETSGRVDLILLDVKLPDMSGLELFDLLRDLSQFDTPVVAVTAGREIPPHVAGVLKKPFDLDALLEMVRKHTA